MEAGIPSIYEGSLSRDCLDFLVVEDDACSILRRLSRPQMHTLNIVLAWETKYFSGKGRIVPLGMWSMLTEAWNQTRLTEFPQLFCLLLQVIDAEAHWFGFSDFSNKALGTIGLGFLTYTKKCIKIKIKVEI